MVFTTSLTVASSGTLHSSSSTIAKVSSLTSAFSILFALIASKQVFITIRFNQAPKVTSPLNWSNFRNAFINASCSASSAIAASFKYRCATINIPSQYWRYKAICAFRLFCLHCSTNNISDTIDGFFGCCSG